MKLCTNFGTRLGMQGCDLSACHFGGARKKGFATLRNVLKLLPRMTEVASELVRDTFEFSDLFLFLFFILARYIDQKGILQKTLKQFGLVASK